MGRGEKKARGERWEGKIGELSKSTSGVERDLIELTLFPFILFLKYQLRAQAEDKNWHEECDYFGGVKIIVLVLILATPA